MRRNADRLLIVFCCFALMALLWVPLEEHGKAPMQFIFSTGM